MRTRKFLSCGPSFVASLTTECLQAWRPKLGLPTRGGVEDTRLKAKEKDTKKIRGQGQPFRGQTFSKPRTGLLKAKDQGHRRKCFPKKKVFKKFFQVISKTKKGLQNNFSGKPIKKCSNKFFQPIYKILAIQKIVLFSSRGQGNFRGLEASRPRPRT